MQAHRDRGIIEPTHFFTSALDGDEWPTPLPCFTPGERIPGTPWVGGWVDIRAGLDTEARKKNSLPQPGIEP
jgi:hypothetical protein